MRIGILNNHPLTILRRYEIDQATGLTKRLIYLAKIKISGKSFGLEALTLQDRLEHYKIIILKI